MATFEADAWRWRFGIHAPGGASTTLRLSLFHGCAIVTLDASMTIVVAEEPMTAIAEYALLPIAFPVDQVLDVTARAEGGFALSARRLEVPYVKDYDAIDGEGPYVSNWTLFTARVAGNRVGWACAHGCRQLKVETQSVNVPACRFYARHGCELRAVHHAAYPELPEEIQLLWYKDLRIEG